MQNLDQRIIVVTGGASGIGRATAIWIAGAGAHVIVADLDDAFRQTVDEIERNRGSAVGLRLDVTSEADWQAAMEVVDQRWGRLDGLVNCAGVAAASSLVDTTLEEWRRIHAVNLDGAFLGTRAAVRLMRRAGRGSIVNVASASGIKAAAGAGAYCASKAAVLMLTRVTALECVQNGDHIRANAVAPGGVKTPIWNKVPGMSGILQSEAWTAPAEAPASKRFAQPEEIARTIEFLLSDAASYVNGAVLAVDAAYTAS